jgi:hypothetical protein
MGPYSVTPAARYDIKNNLKLICREDVDYIVLIQIIFSLWDFVNTVMNLRVHNDRKFAD